jgi:hypothetical protein
MELDMDYRFGISPPRDTALVQMANLRAQQRLFDVTMRLKRRPITRGNLARVLWRFPAMTAQVMGHIYFQAARLWWKGVPYVPHPQPGQMHGNLAPGFPNQPSPPAPSLSSIPTSIPTSSSTQSEISSDSSTDLAIDESTLVNSDLHPRFDEDNEAVGTGFVPKAGENRVSEVNQNGAVRPVC